MGAKPRWPAVKRALEADHGANQKGACYSSDNNEVVVIHVFGLFAVIFDVGRHGGRRYGKYDRNRECHGLRVARHDRPHLQVYFTPDASSIFRITAQFFW